MVERQHTRRAVLGRGTGLALLWSGASAVSGAPTEEDDDYDFHVDITETNAPIVWGETVEFTAEIYNRGYDRGVQTITYQVRETGAAGDILEEGTTTVALGGWEAVEESFSVSTEKARNDRRMLLRVTSEDRADSETVTFEGAQPPAFDVAFTEVPEHVLETEGFDVAFEIENLGHRSGEKDYTVAFGNSTIEEESVELGWREYTEKTVSVPAEDVFAGPRELTVETPDDSATKEVSVLEKAAFQVESVSTGPTFSGEPVVLETRIGNQGDEDGETDVAASVTGIGLETETVAVSAGESKTIQLEVTTDTIQPGEYDAVLTVEGESLEFTVEIREAELWIADVQTNDPVTPDGELDVEVTVQNRGQEELTQDLRVEGFKLGRVDTEMTVDGEEERTEVATFDDFGHVSEGERLLKITTADDSVEVTVDIEEDADNPDDGADDAVDGLGPGFGVPGALVGIGSLAYLVRRRTEPAEKTRN